MQDSLALIFAILISALLLYLWPASEAFERQDDLAYTVAYKSVTNFVNTVRNQGFITPNMYNDFQKELNATGNTYEIKMVHRHKTYVPIYTDPADQSTFQNDFRLVYEEYYNAQIMPVLFPDNADPVDSLNRVYRLDVGDTFAITIKNTNTTPATLIKDFLYNMDTPKERIFIPYGGMVHHADY